MLFSNHSAVKREQIIFILNIIRRRQESGLGISFIDSYHGNTRAVKLQEYKGRSQETVKHNTDHTMKSNLNKFANHKKYSKEIIIHVRSQLPKNNNNIRKSNIKKIDRKVMRDAVE